jgi:branched-chain amino acid transport system permease protein
LLGSDALPGHHTATVVGGRETSLRIGAALSTRKSYARWLSLAVAILLLVVFRLITSSVDLYIADTALLAAIPAIGLNMLTGNAGQVSIGTAAFMAVGAYTIVVFNGHVGFVPAVLIAGLICAVLGALVGLPSLRLRGLYLAFSTLSLQYLVAYAVQEYDQHTNALAGHTISTPSVFGFDIASDSAWYVTFAICVLLCMAAGQLVRDGRPGRAWEQVRTSEVVASSVGVRVATAKVSAFAVSAFLAGCTGALYAYFVGNVSASYFSLSLAISYIAMIIIGGLGSIWGSVVGAIGVTALPFILRSLVGDFAGYQSVSGWLATNQYDVDTIAYGALIIVFLIFEPGGLVGLAGRARTVGKRLSSALRVRDRAR